MRNGIIAGMSALLIALAAWGWAKPKDQDNDGIKDNQDNCVEEPNPGQEDTDEDLCGNHCDSDYNQDGVVNAVDKRYFTVCYDGTFREVCDHAPEELDGVISIMDFGILRDQLRKGVPGPGLSPKCDGKRGPKK